MTKGLYTGFSGESLILFTKAYAHDVIKPKADNKIISETDNEWDNNNKNAATRIEKKIIVRDGITTFIKKEVKVVNKKKAKAPATKPVPHQLLTLKGANYDAYRRILEWIETCVARNQVVDFWCPKGLFQGGLVLEAARFLGIPILKETVNKKLKNILSTQVHTDDVRAIYKHHGPGDEKRQVVVQSIVNAWWEKRLRGEKFYWELHGEIEDFRNDVDELWREKEDIEAARIEEEKAMNPDPTVFELSRQIALLTMERDLARGGNKAAKKKGISNK